MFLVQTGGRYETHRRPPLDKKFLSFGHTVHVIFGEPIDPDEFESVPELLDELRLRITTPEVPQ
jgi:1-acyl-sn-glycerol-3-phosphate acyltransferase